MDYSQLSTLIALGREYWHDVIRDAGISHTAHRICTFLYFSGDVSQDTVAAELMLDKTTVAKALGGMESRGLIFRAPDPKNRRRNLLRITDAGRAAVGGSVHVYDQWFQSVLACLSAPEQRQLDGIMQKLVERARSLRGQTPPEPCKGPDPATERRTP